MLLFALAAAGIRNLDIFNNTEFLMLTLISVTQVMVLAIVIATQRVGYATDRSWSWRQQLMGARALVVSISLVLLLVSKTEATSPGRPLNRPFLRCALLEAPADHFAGVGLGEEIRIDTGHITVGGALELKGALVHLFAFRAPIPNAARYDQESTARHTNANQQPSSAARGPEPPRATRTFLQRRRRRRGFYSVLISPEQEKICDLLRLPFRKMTAPS